MVKQWNEPPKAVSILQIFTKEQLSVLIALDNNLPESQNEPHDSENTKALKPESDQRSSSPVALRLQNTQNHIEGTSGHWLLGPTPPVCLCFCRSGTGAQEHIPKRFQVKLMPLVHRPHFENHCPNITSSCYKWVDRDFWNVSVSQSPGF